MRLSTKSGAAYIHDAEESTAGFENRSSWLYTLFDKDPAPLSAFLVWLLRTYNPTDQPCILDVGCGPGRMLPEYARLGWRAVGIDPDPDFYAQAQRVASTLDAVDARTQGFCDIEDVELFDCIVAANGSFAYLLTFSERLSALQRAYRALKPGGILLLDMPNLLHFLRKNDDPPTQVHQDEKWTVRLAVDYEFDLHEAHFIQINRYTIEDAQGQREEMCKEHHHAIVTFPEIARLLRECCFSDLCTYNSFDARNCERLVGDRMMVSACKPVG